jgi:hypothetical protein
MHGQSGSRSIVLITRNLGASLVWVVTSTNVSFYPREGAAVFAVREAGWTPEPILTCVKKKNKTSMRAQYFALV